MMRRSLIWLAALTIPALVVPVQTGTAAVYEAPYYRTQPVANGGVHGVGCGSCGESPCTKLSRGVTNALTGWMEIPKHVITGGWNANVQPLDGLFVGFIRGTSRALERTGIGVYETVTFFMPGCGPLLCPEYVSLEPGCINWRYGVYGYPQFNPCLPYYGGPVGPRAQPAPGGSGAAAARSAGDAGGAAGVTYPDDYLK